MKYIFLIVFSLLFISCAEKPAPAPTPEPVLIQKIEHSDFMSNMIEEYSLSQENLKKIQFYTSNEIVLSKQSQVESIKISKGVLFVDKTNSSNEIIIKASTPCLFVKGDKKLITVLFDNNVKLNFVNPCANGCMTNSRYYLAAENWADKTGTLELNGVKYKALGMSAETYLTIDKKSLNNNNVESVILKGKLLQ